MSWGNRSGNWGGNRGGGEMDGATIARNFMDGALKFGQGLRQAQEIEANRLKLDDEQGMRQAYEHLAGKLGQSGDISQVEGDPVLNTRHGIMALGKLTADRAATQQSRLAMLKNMEAADDKLYQEFFRPLASQAQEAYQSGDMNRFGALVGQLSRVAPFPYQYQLGADGNFTELFRSTEKGGWVDTGARMTPQQVFDSVRNLMGGEVRTLRGADMTEHYTNPNFLAAAARYRMGTIMGNAEAMANPGKWIPMEKNGHVVYAIPQNSHTDYGAEPAALIHDPKGGASRFGSLRELMDAGYTPVKASTDVTLMQRNAAGKDARNGAGGGTRKLGSAGFNFLEKVFTEQDENGDARVNVAQLDLACQIMSRLNLPETTAARVVQEAMQEVTAAIQTHNADLSPAQVERLALGYVRKRLLGGAGAQGAAQPQPAAGQAAQQAAGKGQQQTRTIEDVKKSLNLKQGGTPPGVAGNQKQHLLQGIFNHWSQQHPGA